MNPIEMFTYDMGSKIKIKLVIFEVFPNHGGNEMKYALLPFCPLYLYKWSKKTLTICIVYIYKVVTT